MLNCLCAQHRVEREICATKSARRHNQDKEKLTVCMDARGELVRMAYRGVYGCIVRSFRLLKLQSHVLGDDMPAHAQYAACDRDLNSRIRNEAYMFRLY